MLPLHERSYDLQLMEEVAINVVLLTGCDSFRSLYELLTRVPSLNKARMLRFRPSTF